MSGAERARRIAVARAVLAAAVDSLRRCGGSARELADGLALTAAAYPELTGACYVQGGVLFHRPRAAQFRARSREESS